MFTYTESVLVIQRWWAAWSIFPRALMKQTQLIDGEREGSGN